MSKIIDLISALQNLPCVSGAEAMDPKKLPACLKDAEIDRFGNLVLRKKAKRDGATRILVEAHRDEIGLCVKEVLSGGFVSAVPCGGFDTAILPGTDFTIYGKVPVRAVATALPPHLTKKDTKNESEKKKEVLLDTGLLSRDAVERVIQIGDTVHFRSTPKVMAGSRITSRGLDNKASVAALFLAYENLSELDADVCFLFSTGEESSSYGVKTFCRRFKPDLAIVVDVGFGYANGLDKSSCIFMGGGPSISFTDTLSLGMSKWAVSVAKEIGIPYQTICEPGGTGTSATAIQVACGGVPSVVLSIPLLNMHTSGEIANECDIRRTADLIVALLERGKNSKEGGICS